MQEIPTVMKKRNFEPSSGIRVLAAEFDVSYENRK